MLTRKRFPVSAATSAFESVSSSGPVLPTDNAKSGKQSLPHSFAVGCFKTETRKDMWSVCRAMQRVAHGSITSATDLFIVLLVGAHGSELLFFHDLHKALLQAFAHQHLQQRLHLYNHQSITLVINLLSAITLVCDMIWAEQCLHNCNACVKQHEWL